MEHNMPRISFHLILVWFFSVQFADGKPEQVEADGWSNKMEDQDHHCLSYTVVLLPEILSLFDCWQISNVLQNNKCICTQE